MIQTIPLVLNQVLNFGFFGNYENFRFGSETSMATINYLNHAIFVTFCELRNRSFFYEISKIWSESQKSGLKDA